MNSVVVQMIAYLDAMIIASTLCKIYRPLDIVTNQNINRANSNDFRNLYTLKNPRSCILTLYHVTTRASLSDKSTPRKNQPNALVL